MVDRLHGKHLEIAVVSNFDTVDEAEALLDLTNGDLEIDADEEVITSDDEHSRDIDYSKVIKGNPTIAVSARLDPDLSVMQEIGVLDADGAWTTAGRNIEAVRIRVFDHSSDASAQTVFEAVDVVPEWSDALTLPANDFGEHGVTFHVNERLVVNPA